MHSWTWTFGSPSMENEVVDRLQSFHLLAEEGVRIELEEEDVAFSKDECG